MIVVAPLHELDDTIACWRPSHIISLASPGATRANLPPDAEILRLTFHDIAGPSDGLSPVSPSDVHRLLEFGAAWAGDHPLLIHCWAGVSRSTAAAYVLACARSRVGDEAIIAGRLRAVAPFATPNPRIVALADAALCRQGAMSSAVAAIGRGMETALGSAFVLR